MGYRKHRFSLLEFILQVDSAAKMFEKADQAHYSTIGHENPTCSAIAHKRTVRDVSLDTYLANNEYFDGELTFADPWPCSKCIPVESLPAWKPLAESTELTISKVPTEPAAKSNLKPYRPTTKPPDNAMASEAQVRKLMVLYRKGKPDATREMNAAAELRAKAMTKKQASTVISKLVGENA